MASAIAIDCIIIGYNEVDYTARLEIFKRFERTSGAYQSILYDSVLTDGVRTYYIDFVNQALKRFTGRDFGLHHMKMTNLGVCYLKSFLVKRGLSVETVGFFNHEKEQLAGMLARGTRTVAITTTFYTDAVAVTELVAFVRRQTPQTPIIVGGPHIFNICEKQSAEVAHGQLAEIGADIYVFEKQGEATLFKVLTRFRESQDARDQDACDLADIANLIYRVEPGGVFTRTVTVPEANSIDEDNVDWTLLAPELYVPSAQMRTARSCAFKCAFCDFPRLGGKLTLAKVETVEHEMRQLQDAGIRGLFVIDDTINVPLPRFKDILRMIIRNRFSFNIFSYFRCSNSDEETFDLMQRAGYRGVFLGIESGDAVILKNMSKAATPEQYQEGICRLDERGIVTFSSFIVGFPGETEQTFQNTIDFTEQAKPTFFKAELYYHHSSGAPIAGRSEQYEITGAGYNWRHSSMDWQRACELVEHMYEEVESSIALPLPALVPYLYGLGVSMDNILGFTRSAGRLIGPARDRQSDRDRVRRVSQSLEPVCKAIGAELTAFLERGGKATRQMGASDGTESVRRSILEQQVSLDLAPRSPAQGNSLTGG